MRHLICSLLLALSAGGAFAQSTVTEVINLRHRIVDEVIPILRPLLPEDAALTGTSNQLVVRTTPANLEMVKDVLQKIDVRQRRLMISVRQDVAANLQSRDDAPVHSYSTRSLEDASDVHTVQTVEGQSAWIETGASVPLATGVVVPGIYGPEVYEGVEYRDVMSGFYVTPRLSGDRVTLEIAPRREQLDPRQGGVVDIQAAQSVVSGRLGEWIDLGGSSQEVHGSHGGDLWSTRRAQTERRSIWVRVDELP